MTPGTENDLRFCIELAAGENSKSVKPGPADWDQIFRLSSKHLISPLLFMRLKKTGEIGNVPGRVADKLETAYYRNASRNTMIFHETARALGVLKKESIPAIMLKGAHLAESVYRDVGARFISDADLLLKREDLDRAREILVKAGFLLDERELPLDIHWNLNRDNYYPFRGITVDSEKIWQRAGAGFVSGEKTLVLSVEDLVVYLSLHLSYHFFESIGVRTVIDIREIIARHGESIDWELVNLYANEWGIGGLVFLVLSLTKELANARLPDGVPENMRPPDFDDRTLEWAKTRILSETRHSGHLSENFNTLWGNAPLREKIKSFRRLLFPPTEYLARSYPETRGLRYLANYFVRAADRSFPHIRALWLLAVDKNTRETVGRYNEAATKVESLIAGSRG